MLFSVLPSRGRPPTTARSKAFLLSDNWDDFGYRTLHQLVYVDADGARHDVGSVKIGRVGLGDEMGRVSVPKAFEVLPDYFFSLGVGDDYYGHLGELGPAIRNEVLRSLRDVAADLELFQRVRSEQVTATSLLRGVPPSLVRGQFHRMANGGARLSRYAFAYSLPRSAGGSNPPPTFTFEVRPNSQPPSNVHVLIGTNGVGKTRLLTLMQNALLIRGSRATNGEIISLDETATDFANVVAVSFSAFDDIEPIAPTQDSPDQVGYSYVGLRQVSAGGDAPPSGPKSVADLAAEFASAAFECSREPKRGRWRRAVEMLRTDPLFAAIDFSTLVEDGGATSRTEVKRSAEAIFRNLSSGHRIVLLTVSRLVQTVEERSVVFLDEPEAHLHPPLLSALVRALSDLLSNRNGVAVVATHSPVILQEVPRSCVWKVRRSGNRVSIDRPEIETFGENVGILTREVFGLEVTKSGFHRLLMEAVDEGADHDEVVEMFGGQLGTEALALVRGTIAQRRRDRREGT